MSFLTVKNIEKSFGSTDVLRGIDFTVEKGEVVVILGSSGSGKTTLLRCLNFLEIADKGTIEIGEDMIFDAATDAFGDRSCAKSACASVLFSSPLICFPSTRRCRI